MSRTVRGLMVGLFSIVAFVAMASSASALTFSSSSITGTAGATTLTINTAGGAVTATCSSSAVSGGVTNSAGTTAPASITSASWSTCRLAGTNLTVTPASLPWSSTVATATGGYTLRINSVLVGFSTAAGCRFNVTGSRTSDIKGSPVASIPFTDGALTLSVSAITGGAIACSAAGIAAGNTATFNTPAAGYTLGSPLTIS